MRTPIGCGLLVGMALWGGLMAARGQVAGGAFRLTGQVIGGGGTSQGGAFLLQGAVTQAATGRSLSVVEPGGNPTDYRVIGGWLGPVSTGSPGRPSMKARLTEDKLAELNWDMDITGYVLEFSSSIGPGAVWQPVSPQPVGMSFTTPCQQPARFFRLRGP